MFLDGTGGGAAAGGFQLGVGGQLTSSFALNSDPLQGARAASQPLMQMADASFNKPKIVTPGEAYGGATNYVGEPATPENVQKMRAGIPRLAPRI